MDWASIALALEEQRHLEAVEEAPEAHDAFALAFEATGDGLP